MLTPLPLLRPFTRPLFVPASGGGTSTYSTEVLADSPVGYWRLGEASGTSAADSSGNGNTLTYTSVALGVTGIPGGGGNAAVRFNGTSGQKATGTATGLPTGATAPFTIEFWHKSSSYTSLSQMFGFGITLSSTGSSHACRCTLEFNGRYYFWGDLADWDSGVAFDTDGAWHHIVWVSDGSNLYLYRDGSLAATKTGLPAFVTAGTQVTLGSNHPSGAPPSGDFDECAIYATALSSTRIAAHYTAGH